MTPFQKMVVSPPVGLKHGFPVTPDEWAAWEPTFYLLLCPAYMMRCVRARAMR